MFDRRSHRACLGFMSMLLLSASTVMAADAAPVFELKDGDRVVTLGGTFIEREGQFGFIESVFTTAVPDRKVTFRNLGWNGDTVWSESRGNFDPAQVGYGRMLELVQELKPTLIVMTVRTNRSQGTPVSNRSSNSLKDSATT